MAPKRHGSYRLERFDRNARRRRKRRLQKIIVAVSLIILIIAFIGLIFYFAQEPSSENPSAKSSSQSDIAESIDKVQESIESSSPIIIEESSDVSDESVSVEEDELPTEEESTPVTAGNTGSVKRKIVVDPGHGGYDNGSNIEEDGIFEKNINLAISLKLRDILVDMGYDVVMTRDDDTHLYLDDRSSFANEYKADICISVHQNMYEKDNVHGTETLYLRDDSEKLAKYVQKYLVDKIKTRDRSAAIRDLHMVRETTMPSCLVEVGFISNPDELKNLLDDAFQKKAAQGIANGIKAYFDELDQ